MDLLLTYNLKYQCLRSSGLGPLNLELQCLRQSELDVLTLKLDWASPKALTTTPSRLECLLLTATKEDLGLLSRLLTVNKFNTLIMGSKTWYLGS